MDLPKRISLVIFLAVALITAALVACDDDNGGSGDVEAQLAAIEEQLQDLQGSLDSTADSLASAQLVAALDALDGLSIHSFDETTTAAESLDDVPAGYLADVRKVTRVVNAISWPGEVQDEVDSILALADELEAALGGDDLAEIKEASPRFHGAWHSLREVGYSALTAEEPADDDHDADVQHAADEDASDDHDASEGEHSE